VLSGQSARLNVRTDQPSYYKHNSDVPGAAGGLVGLTEGLSGSCGAGW